jgi:AcrR family transcriptional regulator
MARPRLDRPVPDLHLSPALDGVKSLMGNDIGTRERLILLAIDEIRKHGPSEFNARVVCDRLELKQAMVPYHFGSREALIAEATIWAYRDWSTHPFEILQKTQGDGEKRLRAFIDDKLKWSARMGPVAVLVHYPMMSDTVNRLLESAYEVELRQRQEFQIAVTSYLVIDIRNGTSTPIGFDWTKSPGVDEALTHASEFLAAGSILWASHGLALWMSGQHLPSTFFGQFNVEKIGRQFVINNHIDEIVAIAKGQR